MNNRKCGEDMREKGTTRDDCRTSGICYVIKSSLDILLPRTCCVCGRRLFPEERHICRECLEDLPLTFTWDRRFNGIADRLNEAIQESISEYEPYSFVASLFFYDEGNGYRHICHNLKYHGDISEGRYFSRILGRFLAGSPLFKDVDIVIPVPLHWTREWSRGYNQAAIIGKEIACILGAGFYPSALRRTRRTVSQTTLDYEDKRKNVTGAFSLSEKMLSLRPDEYPRHILLTDDVFTSGSTTAACHNTLRRIFPASVRISVATLAAVDI